MFTDMVILILFILLFLWFLEHFLIVKNKTHRIYVISCKRLQRILNFKQIFFIYTIFTIHKKTHHQPINSLQYIYPLLPQQTPFVGSPNNSTKTESYLSNECQATALVHVSINIKYMNKISLKAILVTLLGLWKPLD